MNLKYHEAFSHCKDTCPKLKLEECKQCGQMVKPLHDCIKTLKFHIQKEKNRLEFMKIDELDNLLVAVETLVCKSGHSLVKVRGELLEQSNGKCIMGDLSGY